MSLGILLKDLPSWMRSSVTATESDLNPRHASFLYIGLRACTQKEREPKAVAAL